MISLRFADIAEKDQNDTLRELDRHGASEKKLLGIQKLYFAFQFLLFLYR